MDFSDVRNIYTACKKDRDLFGSSLHKVWVPARMENQNHIPTEKDVHLHTVDIPALHIHYAHCLAAEKYQRNVVRILSIYVTS